MADPSFQAVVDGQTARAVHISQVIDWASGSLYVPATHKATSTASYVLTLQTLDTTNGLIANYLNASGTSVFAVTKNGVSLASLALTGAFTVGGAAVFATGLSITTGGATLTGAVNIAGTASTLTVGGATVLGVAGTGSSLTVGGAVILPGPTSGVTGNGFSMVENVSGSPIWGLQRIFTPEQFGAVRNGSTDDGPAIQNAITAAKNAAGEVRLSQGVYRSNQCLTGNNAVSGLAIRGPIVGRTDGAPRCTIRFTNSITGTAERNHFMEFVGTDSLHLEGFNLKGDTATDGNTTGIANRGAATGIFSAPAGSVLEGNGHIVMKEVYVSGPFKTAAVYLWSPFYVTIENCGFFTNGTASSNAALSISQMNYAALYSTTTAVVNGSLSGATSGTSSYVDGARQISIRQSLIYNQSSSTATGTATDVSGTGLQTYGIYLDTVRNVTIQDCEPTTQGTGPSIIFQDSATTNYQSSNVTIDHCQMGATGTTNAAIVINSGSIIDDLRVTGCYVGNLAGTGGMVRITQDGGKLRNFKFWGNRFATTPTYAVKINSSTTGAVLLGNTVIDCKVMAVGGGPTGTTSLTVDAGTGAIESGCQLFSLGGVTTGGGNVAEVR